MLAKNRYRVENIVFLEEDFVDMVNKNGIF